MFPGILLIKLVSIWKLLLENTRFGRNLPELIMLWTFKTSLMQVAIVIDRIFDLFYVLEIEKLNFFFIWNIISWKHYQKLKLREINQQNISIMGCTDKGFRPHYDDACFM